MRQTHKMKAHEKKAHKKKKALEKDFTTNSRKRRTKKRVLK